MIDEAFMLIGEEPGLEDKQAHAGTPVMCGAGVDAEPGAD